MKAYDILKSAYDEELVNHVFDAFREIERNYILKKWKPSELDAGHFVETVRRILEFEFSGTYTPFSAQLPKFTDATLKNYESQNCHESFRLLIPRALKSIYNIRNKRGVAHISAVSPNEMDATYILYSVKWIFAEIIRLKSGLSTTDTQSLIDNIVERHIPLLWKDKGFERILNPKIPAHRQILIFLYDCSPRMAIELQQLIEYRNTSNFLKIIRNLHNDRLIFYHEDGNCHLSPRGVIEAEKILQRNR